MDDLTFRRLIESGHSYPEVTDIVYDINQLEALTLDSVNVSKIGFDTVWDKMMFNFHHRFLGQGFEILEKLIEKRDLKIRLIVETNAENIESINAIKYYDIRHLDNIKGNFGIMDKRTYMIYVFYKDIQKPEQAFFSNSKSLVEKQEALFDKLWEIAVPLRKINKIMKLPYAPEFHKSFINFEDVRTEIMSFLDECKKELLILSSIKMLDYFADDDSYWMKISVLLRKGIRVKILTDGYNQSLIHQLNKLRNTYGSNKDNSQIQIGYSTKLGNITEFILIGDGMQAIELGYDTLNQFEVSFLNEKNHILVQEILFEKCWNEIESLSSITRN